MVIEHNLDVVKTADWVIDLGPEGGSGGGEILVAGTPEQIAACEKSYTGKYFKADVGIVLFCLQIRQSAPQQLSYKITSE
ncbi:UvrABC system protein A [Alishewanella longhuensis]